MQAKNLYFIGSFADRPGRILSYATAASSLGEAPRCISTIADVDHSDLDPEQFVFTDETAISGAYAALTEYPTNRSLKAKLCKLMLLSDKFRVRQLTSKSFPHEHFLITSYKDIAKIELTDKPWVCKPRWGSNSRDVQEITNLSSLHALVEPILSRDNHAVIERSIKGRHICVDFVWSGTELKVIGFCEKRMMHFGRKIVEAFHTLSDETAKSAKLARDYLLPIFSENLPGVRCTIHGEFIVEDNTGEIKIAELNPRAPWGMLPELFSIGNSVSFDQVVIANALGQEFSTCFRRKPAVLGSVFTETFFCRHEAVSSQGNTLFIEKFDEPEDTESKANHLIKCGRFLLWGESDEAVRKEWDDLSSIAVPERIRSSPELDTSRTWKSKCC